MGKVTPLILLAPFFFLFELWQLVVAERYVGVKQIARGADPRALGPGELTSAVWSLLLLTYGLWMIALTGFRETRIFALCLIATTGFAYAIRSRCKLTVLLVTLTIEGSVRIGLLVWACTYAWHNWH